MNPASRGTRHPAPQYPDPVVPVANLPAPRYQGLRTPVTHPLAPPFPGLNTNNADDGNHPRATYNQNRRMGYSPAVWRDSRILKWAMFLLGNLISVAVTVSEISVLSVCFDESLSEDDDDTPEENADTAYICMMMWLVFGLWVDVSSAVILSAKYRLPLDIKSAHKISPGSQHRMWITMINFVSPFCWGLVYYFGSLASAQFENNLSCDGVGGAAFDDYLETSGRSMSLLGSFMLVLSVLVLWEVKCCFCSVPPADQSTGSLPPRGSFATLGDTVNKKVLPLGPILDLGWQLQAAVLSYRAGSFGLATAIAVGLSGVVREVLSAFGSFAWGGVHELEGPILV